MKASAGNHKSVLIIVENLPCPFDRRVWQEARSLTEAGYAVSIICPKGKGFDAREEVLEGIRIFRHPAPFEADGMLGYVLEYGFAFIWEALLTLKVARRHGFDVIHACNPPDTIFLIGAFWKLFGKKFIFDHHDINPELFEVKFGKRGWLYRLTRMLERLSFRTADVSIATNDSYKRIAIERGGMSPEDVFVVRSGPDVGRLKPARPDPSFKHGRTYLVGYVGVIGKQEGIDYLLRSIEYIVYTIGRRDIQFCVIGGGTELDAMRRYAAQLKIEEFVTFTGRVSDMVLVAALSTTDICVNPDPFNEMNDKSTMNKIMEYMALGKPIVQFDMTEGRYSAGASAVYAKRNDERDFADKIINLLSDGPARERMAALGLQRVSEHLAWHHQVPQLLAAYDRAFR
jgi:glycosyltransferase involved in cell wall biosynthesis